MIKDRFPEKRQRRKKRMPGENAPDEPIASAEKGFEVNVFNKVMDITVQIIKSRFQKNSEVILDLACLSPIQFKTLTQSGLTKCDEDIMPEKLVRTAQFGIQLGQAQVHFE